MVPKVPRVRRLLNMPEVPKVRGVSECVQGWVKISVGSFGGVLKIPQCFLSFLKVRECSKVLRVRGVQCASGMFPVPMTPRVLEMPKGAKVPQVPQVP